MLKGHNFRAAHIILLAVAINALAVTFWLALTSIIPIGITPGFGPSHDIAAGIDWVGVLGPSILWLALFAVGGVLVAARIVFMQWVRGAPASVDRTEVGRRTTTGPQWCMSHANIGTVSKRTRPSLKS
jgi:hypothetical protein